MKKSCALAIIFIAGLFGTSKADVPQNLWGYSLGQSASDALAVDPSRSLQDCDFKGVWKCITFDQKIFSEQKGEVEVQFSSDEKVEQIAFHVFAHEQTPPLNCAETDAVIVANVAKVYGMFTSHDPGKSYRWEDGTSEFELVTICAGNVGGVIGSLSRINRP